MSRCSYGKDKNDWQIAYNQRSRLPTFWSWLILGWTGREMNEKGTAIVNHWGFRIMGLRFDRWWLEPI